MHSPGSFFFEEGRSKITTTDINMMMMLPACMLLGVVLLQCMSVPLPIYIYICYVLLFDFFICRYIQLDIQVLFCCPLHIYIKMEIVLQVLFVLVIGAVLGVPCRHCTLPCCTLPGAPQQPWEAVNSVVLAAVGCWLPLACWPGHTNTHTTCIYIM